MLFEILSLSPAKAAIDANAQIVTTTTVFRMKAFIANVLPFPRSYSRRYTTAMFIHASWKEELMERLRQNLVDWKYSRVVFGLVSKELHNDYQLPICSGSSQCRVMSHHNASPRH